MTIQPSYGTLLDSVRGIKWPAVRRVRGNIPGVHQSKMRGVSAEFTEYRPYRQGDELRRIDWKLFARSDRLFIRISVERAILPTTIIVDASGSMGFPLKTLGKWELARQMAIALSSAAHQTTDPIGIIISSNSSQHQLRPRARRDVVHQIMAVLDKAKPAGNAKISEALDMAMRKSMRVAIVSDFLGDDTPDVLKNAGQYIAAGREVHAVHIVAEEEINPSRATALVSDPERPEERRPMVDEARDEYLENFGAWREELSGAWLGMGARYCLAITGGDPVSRMVRRMCVPQGPAGARA